MKPPAISAPHKSHDAWLLGIAAFALILELGLLFHQLRLLPLNFLSLKETSGRVPIGNLVRKARSVQERAPGSLSWYPLAPGDAISENDTVMTGAASTAVIAMRDGAELILEPFTLMRFNSVNDTSRDRLALEINRGSIKVRSRTQELRLAFKDGSVRVSADSEIVVSSPGEATQSTLEVKTGGATVEREGGSVALTPGQAVALTSDRAPLALLTRFAPQDPTPGNGAQIFISGSRGPVGFAWQGDADAQVEWDTSSEMAAPHLVPAAASRASVSLSAGRYFWRLKKGQSRSNAMEFTVLPKAEYKVNSALSLLKAKEGVEIPLRWSPVPEAEGYLFELASDDKFSRIEKSLQLKQPEITLPALGKGKFFWRVQAQGALGNWPFSPVYDLQIKKRMEAPKLKGAKQLHLKEKREPATKGKRGSLGKWEYFFRLASVLLKKAHAGEGEKLWLQFFWEPAPGAKAYRLEISTRRDFKKVLSETEGTRTTALVEVPDHEQFYWRVAAIDEDGDLGEFSAPKVVKREAAVKAPQPPREVAQIPPAPVVPARVLEKVNAEPPEPPRKRFFQTWAGYGASYLNQNLTGAGYVMQSRGLPFNRFVAGMATDFERTTLELDAWVQPLVYTTSTAAAQNRLQWGADIFWSRLALRRHFPIGIGVRIREENYVSALSDSGVTLGASVFTGVLLGTTWLREGRWPWAATLAAEVGLMGDRTGYGLIWRNRVGIPYSIAGLQPALEVLLHPQYRAVKSAATTEFNVEVSVALVLEWDKPLPTIAVRNR
jgi:hypothetical protein